MIQRPTIRRQLAWTALVVLLCSVVASLRVRRRNAEALTSVAQCTGVDHDSVALMRVALDTVARLRERSQRAVRFTRRPDGVEVRTEDADPIALHDGGLVAFDCKRRVTFLWLDGG